MTMDSFSFKRPHLAIAYCDSLAGKGIAHAASGLFLAGPRRVGKSTFLKENLIPEINQRDWISIYVDLWANKNADPGHLVIEAIKRAIATHTPLTTKLTQATKQIKIMGSIVLDFANPGLPDNMSLADALRLLNEITHKPLVLLVDEAQHALTTPDGQNTMFAIKSARDQLNRSDQTSSLMLVLTGSNRDKLTQLVIKKDQPFFGSEITPFPLLGKDYTDAFTEWVNRNLATHNQFTKDSMWTAFKLVGHRPEVLRQIVGRTAISGAAHCFTELLEKDANIWQSRLWEDFENDFNALSLLHQVILTELVNKGRTWSPFSDESLQYYKKVTEQSEITTSTVQAAIQQLRERGFIWQSSRGSYALEDDSFQEWFKLHAMQCPINPLGQ